MSFGKTMFDLDIPIGDSGKRPILQPGQKPLHMMRHVMQKFILPTSMLPEPCFETGATSKACLVQQKHEKFTGWEADNHCTVEMMPSLLQIFSLQVLDIDSYINIGEDVWDAP